MLLELLQRIKTLEESELNEIVEKLSFLDKDELTIKDLSDAISCCRYHFSGEGFYESMGDMCPCNCLCMNCEMIPEHPIGVKMQEIGTTMVEENVMTEFIKKYSKEKYD